MEICREQTSEGASLLIIKIHCTYYRHVGVLKTVHITLFSHVRTMPDILIRQCKEPYNVILNAIVAFRKVHYDGAEEYIDCWTDDPKGTGASPPAYAIAQTDVA